MKIRGRHGTLGFALFLVAVLPACGSIGSEALVPSDEEIPSIEKATGAGDKDAIVKLVLYYGRRGDDESAERWFKRCLDQKISFCFADRASEIAGEMREEKDPAKLSSMRTLALGYANKAISYEKDERQKKYYIKMRSQIEKFH